MDRFENVALGDVEGRAVGHHGGAKPDFQAVDGGTLGIDGEAEVRPVVGDLQISTAGIPGNCKTFGARPFLKRDVTFTPPGNSLELFAFAGNEAPVRNRTDDQQEKEWQSAEHHPQ